MTLSPDRRQGLPTHRTLHRITPDRPFCRRHPLSSRQTKTCHRPSRPPCLMTQDGQSPHPRNPNDANNRLSRSLHRRGLVLRSCPGSRGAFDFQTLVSALAIVVNHSLALLWTCRGFTSLSPYRLYLGYAFAVLLALL